MVRHVILWKLKDMPEAEKTAVKAGIKAGLEGLAGRSRGCWKCTFTPMRCPALPMRT